MLRDEVAPAFDSGGLELGGDGGLIEFEPNRLEFFLEGTATSFEPFEPPVEESDGAQFIIPGLEPGTGPGIGDRTDLPRHRGRDVLEVCDAALLFARFLRRRERGGARHRNQSEKHGYGDDCDEEEAGNPHGEKHENAKSYGGFRHSGNGGGRLRVGNGTEERAFYGRCTIRAT